jgi:hypothetical protein
VLAAHRRSRIVCLKFFPHLGFLVPATSADPGDRHVQASLLVIPFHSKVALLIAVDRKASERFQIYGQIGFGRKIHFGSLDLFSHVFRAIFFLFIYLKSRREAVLVPS